MNPFDALVRFETFLQVLIAMLLTVLVALGFAYASTASAQTVPGSMRMQWVLPSTGCTLGAVPCDNVPLAGDAVLTGIEVYISTSPIADNSTMAPTLTLAAGATTVNHAMQVANGATLYARLKAVNAHGKSPAFSTQVSKLVRLPVLPGVVTGVTVELTITP